MDDEEAVGSKVDDDEKDEDEDDEGELSKLLLTKDVYPSICMGVNPSQQYSKLTMGAFV